MIRDLEISRDDPSLIAITFNKRIEIHEVNLVYGTSTVE